MARYECFDCNKNLDGHPKIKVEGDIYCYSCAKKLSQPSTSPKKKRHANDLKDYEAKVARWENWKKNLESALPSKTTRIIIIVGVAIGCAMFFANPVLFLPGLLVGLIAKHFHVQSRKRDWTRINPEPAFPSRPSTSFVRDRIELVGGVSGTSLSSGFREKILERDGYQCQICDQVFPANQLEVHHIKPRAKMGKHYSTNLVTLCWRCHREESWFGHKHKMR